MPRAPEAPGAGAARGRAFTSREIGLRAASGLVLAVATLLLTWGGPWPFAVLVATVAVIAIWEWGCVVRSRGFDMMTIAAAAGLVAATAVAAGGATAGGLALVGLTAAGVGVAGRLGEKSLLEGAGVLYIGLPAMALVWLRSDPVHGFAAIVMVLIAVWATDIGAFIVGRLVGGPKLCPAVSPNKTWAGLIGGVALSAVAGYTLAVNLGSSAPLSVVGLSMGLAVISQFGDLVESGIKRSYGVKDTSGLIPGHGGFLDRVDGLLLAAVAAAVYVLWTGAASQGAALLGFA
jgi:phosphatidate cytidylyltransferase